MLEPLACAASPLRRVLAVPPRPRSPPPPPAAPPPPTRPRFVTTVRAGEFLPPPPSVARLLLLEELYECKEHVYLYGSRPAVVQPRKRRSRRDLNYTHVGEITGAHDKRKSGPTAFPHGAGDGGAAAAASARAVAARRRARAARLRLRPGTPPPAPGRLHHPVQTENYLEELFDKGEEMEVGVQTDLFLDRPSTPLYVPAKTGVDVATQIYPGDLFDFDVEVSCVVEALVGGCARAALGEAARDEELAALRDQRRRLRDLREAERARRDHLAAHDTRLFEEKERRVAAAAASRAAARAARARAAASTLLAGYVRDLLPSTLAGLREHGYLWDTTQTGIEEEFVPWLVSEVSKEIEQVLTSRDLITDVVLEAVSTRLARGWFPPPEREPTPPSSLTPPSTYGEEEEEVQEPPPDKK